MSENTESWKILYFIYICWFGVLFIAMEKEIFVLAAAHIEGLCPQQAPS